MLTNDDSNSIAEVHYLGFEEHYYDRDGEFPGPQQPTKYGWNVVDTYAYCPEINNPLQTSTSQEVHNFPWVL